MFTQTAIASAISMVGVKSDPSRVLSGVTSMVAQYVASAERRQTSFENVMNIISRMKAIMKPLDNDIAEIQVFLDETQQKGFSLEPEEALGAVDSLSDLSGRLQSSITAFDSMRLILNHMDTFAPHQNLFDSAMLSELRRLKVFKGNVHTLISICRQYTDKRSETGPSVQESIFEMALARASSVNRDTLRALADK